MSFHAVRFQGEMFPPSCTTAPLNLTSTGALVSQGPSTTCSINETVMVIRCSQLTFVRYYNSFELHTVQVEIFEMLLISGMKTHIWRLGQKTQLARMFLLQFRRCFPPNDPSYLTSKNFTCSTNC